MRSVHGNEVEFADGKRYPFDAIVFATGYRSTTKQWLKVRACAYSTHARTCVYASYSCCHMKSINTDVGRE